MITAVDFDKLYEREHVLVISRQMKYLAHGTVTQIDSTTKCVEIEITSFDTTGLDVRSCIDSDNPSGNSKFTIGESAWFYEENIFWIMDDDK